MQVFVVCKKNLGDSEPQVFQDQGEAMLAFKNQNTEEEPLGFYAVEMAITL